MNDYTFPAIPIGLRQSFSYGIDTEKLQAFREISGDSNPLHTDVAFAQAHGFEEIVVYGQLTASALSTLAGMYLPGKYSLIQTVETHYLAPVYLSRCPLEVSGVVKDKDDRFQTITVKFDMCDQSGTKVCRGSMRIGFLRQKQQ